MTELRVMTLEKSYPVRGPHDSILLTNKPIFYSLVSGHSNIVGPGILYTEIYAHPNSEIDLHQKVSIGFKRPQHRAFKTTCFPTI
jgi:hypothetical protein